MDKVQIIINTCSGFYGVPVDHIIQPSRSLDANFRERVVARQSAMVLMLQFLKMQKRAIGQIIGGRDHSTVIYAEKAIQDLLDTDKEFKANFERLKKEVHWNIEKGKVIFSPSDIFKRHGYMFT